MQERSPPARGRFVERAPLWLLVALLILVFFTGGSTWSSEPQLMLLRPAAVIAAAIALFTIRAEHFHRFAALWIFGGSVVVLIIAHLIPLPVSWWSQLPGRGILVAIDEVAGLGPIARPLSMSPDATVNALLSLVVPIAVVLLAVQIDAARHAYIFAAVLALALVSGGIGLMQAGGAHLEFYPLSSGTAGLFANRNHQGALLALLLPMAAAVSVLDFGGRIRPRTGMVLGLAIAVIAVPLIVVTGSRSALILLGIALVLALLIWTGRRAGASSWQVRLALPLALGVSVLGLVGLTVFTARDVALDRLQDSGEDLRWPVWQSIVEQLPAYMPWGTGIGSYAEAYQVLEPDTLLRPTRSNHAHNEVLEIALTAGVPGLILLGVATLLVVLAFWRAFSSGGGGPAVVLARLGSVVILLLALASMTDYPVRTPILSAILALAAVWASLGVKRADTFTQIQGGK